MTVAALIVAAGRGTRAADTGSTANQQPKQYVTLGERTVLQRAIDAFARSGLIDYVQVVIHPDDGSLYRAAVTPAASLLEPAAGGATRQASVLAGLEALARISPDSVLIHDAARPFVERDVIARVLAAIQPGQGAIAAIQVTDTLKRAGATGEIVGTVDRDGLWRAQTPQGFLFGEILAAHRRAAAEGLDTFTDDAALAEWAGLDVRVVAGGDRNQKLTSREDLAMAETLVGAAGNRHPATRSDETRFESRAGTGFDVHRFAPGDGVHLCGVLIPHTARLDGHSDADVGLHALTDALLGAIGDGDIGQHFPPSDQRWKGAASDIFLRHAADLVRKRGGRIVNVDVTILAEAPRVGPHRTQMCARIADILDIAADRVSVKATTTEGLGFTGRREGIAAMASASVELPVSDRR